MQENEFVSAVGHKSTAIFLSKLFNIEILYNRITIKMDVGDMAIVFELLQRLKEGQVLNFKDLSIISFRIGLLTRLE